MPSKPKKTAKKASAVNESRGERVKAFEAVISMSWWKQAAVIFAAGLIIRLILDFLFFSTYGWHAANHLETWFYYAVAQGAKLPAGGVMDPTVWMLRLGGMVLPGELPLYYVVAMSAVLSSLSAVAIFLLAREEYGGKPGLAAGLIYAFMVQPIALSLVGFTHDHLQLLFFVLTILAAVKAAKSRGLVRIAFAAAFVLLVYNGMHLNPVIWVAAVISVLYAAGHLVKERSGDRAYDLYFKGALAFFAVGVVLMLPAINQELTDLPQGRSGSIDVAPIKLPNFWLRFNVLLALLPLAAAEAYRRRDLNSMNVMIAGLVLSAVMDRGTRVLDIGVAIATANLFCGWRPIHFKYLAALTFLTLAFFLLQANVDGFYNTAFIAAGIAISVSAFRLGGDRIILAVTAVLLLLGVSANLIYIYRIDARKVTTEAEYATYKWLFGQKAEGKVLVGWDHGYFLETVSGLRAASTPNRIDHDAHDALWLPERQAALKLRSRGVEYVVVSDLNFNIIKAGGAYSLAINGGLLFEPPTAPPIELVKSITIYKLRNAEASPEYFEKVFETKDRVTGVNFMIYRVVINESLRNGENPVTVFISNQGGEKKVLAKVGLSDGKNIYAKPFNTTLRGAGVSEELYIIEGDAKGSLNCSATIEPLDFAWGYGGYMTYQNNGTAGTYNITIALVDATQSKEEGKTVTEDRREMQIHFEPDEKRTVPYTFQKKYQSHQYMVAHSKNPNLLWVENESIQPSIQNARVVYAFC